MIILYMYIMLYTYCMYCYLKFFLPVAALAPLGALTGGLLAGLPLSRLGRRLTLILTAAIYVVAFLVLGSSYEHESLPVILVSRVACGLGVGMSIPAAQIYVSECTEPSVRGLLGSLPALFMALGTLVTYVVGAVLPWHHLAYFCVAFPLILLGYKNGGKNLL